MADRVRNERLRRGWSVRRAAIAGEISNTYWGEFEDYKRPLTPTIARAVAKAYAWSEAWPDDTEVSPPPSGEWTPLDRFLILSEQVDRLAVRVADLDDAIDQWRQGGRGAR